MRLKTIYLEEYVLEYKEFIMEKILRQKENSNSITNESSFKEDLAKNRLDRYKETFVAYKEGVFCGQSCDEEILRKNVYYTLCTPNVDIFKVPKKENKQNPTSPLP